MAHVVVAYLWFFQCPSRFMCPMPHIQHFPVHMRRRIHVSYEEEDTCVICALCHTSSTFLCVCVCVYVFMTTHTL